MHSLANPDDPVIAVHATHAGAEAVVKALGHAGFDLKTVSIVGKGGHSGEHALGFYTVGDRVRAWGASGGLWGAVWGLLLGSAVFVMPPLGIVAAAGPITAALVAALEGVVVVGGMSTLSAALASVGLPHDQAVKYEADVAADRFLLIVHGTQEHVALARAILAAADAPQALPFHQAA
jgi:hypothetical protein